MTKNPLWDLIQSYMDDPKHRYSPRPADLARETGISEQVLSKWKARSVLPEARVLMKFATGTGLSYSELLVAALQGKGYMPRGSALALPAGFDEWLHQSFDQALASAERAERYGADGDLTLDVADAERHLASVKAARQVTHSDHLSDAADRPDPALAADPGDDAAGESESYNEP